MHSTDSSTALDGVHCYTVSQVEGGYGRHQNRVKNQPFHTLITYSPMKKLKLKNEISPLLVQIFFAKVRFCFNRL